MFALFGFRFQGDERAVTVSHLRAAAHPPITPPSRRRGNRHRQVRRVFPFAHPVRVRGRPFEALPLKEIQQVRCWFFSAQLEAAVPCA